ncbi:hypothetical protein [Streptomyces sp. enrichment culture]|uniref:hypothetical protein n=1 Tax=Streptomyces sp. enrichment culture TaxID=1795815 RepID=UPI003F54800F
MRDGTPRQGKGTSTGGPGAGGAGTAVRQTRCSSLALRLATVPRTLACRYSSRSRRDGSLAAVRKTARQRLWAILAAPKRFTALPDDLRSELIATLLGQCIQLAGRGRRGQTHVELHFIDGAFHDTTWGSDLPTLVRDLYTSYTATELAGTGRTYGYTAEEFLDYAQAPHLRAGLRSGYPDHFGVAA